MIAERIIQWIAAVSAAGAVVLLTGSLLIDSMIVAFALSFAGTAAFIFTFFLLALMLFRMLGDESTLRAIPPERQDSAFRPTGSIPVAAEQSAAPTRPWADSFDVAIEDAVERVPAEGTQEVPSEPLEGRDHGWWGTFLAWGEQEVGGESIPRGTPGLLQTSLDHNFLLAALRFLGPA